MTGRLSATALIALAAIWAGPAASQVPGLGISPDAKFLAPLPPLPADAPPPPRDPRDFSGVWFDAKGMTDLPDGPGAPTGPPVSVPAYSAAGLAYKQHFADMEKQGKPLAGPEALCRPAVNVRGSYNPAIIVQSPDEVLIIGEARRTAWHIHLDRGHPANPKPSFWGDSVGRWEGDTLVVDTIGFNGREALISPQQHVVTRIRKVAGGRELEMTFRVEDPVNLTRPYERVHSLAWRPDIDPYEDECELNPEDAREGLYIEK